MQVPLNLGSKDPNLFFADIIYGNDARKIPLVNYSPGPELDPPRILGEHSKQIPPNPFVIKDLDSLINEFSKCILQIDNTYFSNSCQGLAKCYELEVNRLAVWRNDIGEMFGTVEEHGRMIEDIFTKYQNCVPAEEIHKRREQISINRKRVIKIYTMLNYLIKLKSVGR